MEAGNLFDKLPTDLSSEVIQTLIESSHVRIERIVSHGQATPPDFWYEQSQHEWVVVLQGAATLEFEDDSQPLNLTAGDFVNIQAHRRHRVASTQQGQPTIWLAIHYGEKID